MANELVHATADRAAAGKLTQAEFDSITAHRLNSQAIGDIIYASTTSQLRRLGIGNANQLLIVSGGIPTWANPTTLALGASASITTSAGDLTLNPAGGINVNSKEITNFLRAFGAGPEFGSNVDNNLVTLHGGRNLAGKAAFLYLTGSDYGNPGRLSFQTPNAAKDATITRLDITGAVAEALASWQNIKHNFGTGYPTQATVGAAGAASALPANPTGYIRVQVAGAEMAMPYYAQA